MQDYITATIHRITKLRAYMWSMCSNNYGVATIFGWVPSFCILIQSCFYTPATKLGGYIGFTLSVCPSVRPSVRPLIFRVVRPVASTVQDGFFPYLVQMINSIRGCVACDDPWPWPISSRSFGLDFANHVRSVASTVLDGFFLYLAQMITIIRGCVACYVFFQNLEIWMLGKFLKFFGLDLGEKNLQFSMDSFHI